MAEKLNDGDDTSIVVKNELVHATIEQHDPSSNQNHLLITNEQQSSETNEQQGSETNEQQGLETNEQQGSETNEQQGLETNEQQATQSNEQQGLKTNEQQGSETNGQQGSKTNGQQGSETNEQQATQSNGQQGSETNDEQVSVSNKHVSKSYGQVPKSHHMPIGNGRHLRNEHRLSIEDDVSETSEDIVERHKKSNSERSVSWAWPFVFITLGVVVYHLVKMNYDTLPEAITELETSRNPRLFSGHRAAAILKNITSLGERVTGSEANEVSTPALLVSLLTEIRANKHPSQNLAFEIQTGSGAYNLDKISSFTSVYQNINNVIAKLDGRGGNQSILVNCHYDSVPSSIGASDDAASCAVMLEVLRALSSSSLRLFCDVIFLFNGSEEPSLAGSHLFLQHRWADGLFAFINMEGMGGGGEPFLFQASPRTEWLFNYYAGTAPYPHAQVFADELFDTGVIPSVTDFTVFMDFANLAGLDFAFVRNGYVHHSKYDTPDYISTSSYQVYGEDILATLRNYGNTESPDDGDLYDFMVFYDYLGWFMIYYTKYTGNFVNILITIVTLCSVALFSYITYNGIEILYSTLATLFGILLGFVMNICVALFMDNVPKLAMTFYSNGYLLFPLYWFPCLIGFCIPPYLMDLWRKKNNVLHLTRQAQVNLASFQIPWAIALFTLTCMSIRSAYIIFVMLVSTSVANVLLYLIKPLYKTHFLWIWVYLFINIPAVLYQIYFAMLINLLIVPILGRSGPMNADLTMAMISTLLALLVSSFILPLMTLVRGRIYVLLTLCLASVLAIMLASLTPLGMPYRSGASDPAPQRFFTFHTERNFYLEENVLNRSDTGYLMLNIDRNTLRTLPENLTLTAETISTENSIKQFDYNFISRLSTYGSTNTWFPTDADAPRPQLTETLSLNVIERICDLSTCNLTLEFRGADRIMLYFIPKHGVSLASWTVPAEEVIYEYHDDRPVYYVFFIMGEISSYRLELNFLIDGVEDVNSLMDIGLAGYATHHPELRTSEFTRFLDDLPEYSTVTGWNCVFNHYIL